MNDVKNILIACFSTSSSILTAIEMKSLITILSAIVLPVMFFAIGKTIDVLLYIYFRNRDEKRRRGRRNDDHVEP
ncbi:MAG: hypothetical protein WBD27_14645 [Pyrinomonadaceae bacterium]